jgi:predicted RNA methylase
MWLQSRDVTKMTVYERNNFDSSILNIYRESFILE